MRIIDAHLHHHSVDYWQVRENSPSVVQICYIFRQGYSVQHFQLPGRLSFSDVNRIDGSYSPKKPFGFALVAKINYLNYLTISFCPKPTWVLGSTESIT